MMMKEALTLKNSLEEKKRGGYRVPPTEKCSSRKRYSQQHYNAFALDVQLVVGFI